MGDTRNLAVVIGMIRVLFVSSGRFKLLLAETPFRYCKMMSSKIRSSELVRKAIHICSAVFPLTYWFFLERDMMLKIMIFMASGFILAEFLRLQYPVMRRPFVLVFGPALRDHEQEKLTGATYMFTAAVICIFLFPKEVAVPALLILSVSDTAAALIGIPFGRHAFMKKSVEGSFAFFTASLIILYFFMPDRVLAAILIAALITLVEALPAYIDDNLLIPLSAAIAIWTSGLL